jgi:hypothetical protein
MLGDLGPYEEDRNARPLKRKMMLRFVQNLINDERDRKSSSIDVVSAALSNLPPCYSALTWENGMASTGIGLPNR